MTQAQTTKAKNSPVKSQMTFTQSAYGTQKVKTPSGPSAQQIMNNDYRIPQSNLLVDQVNTLLETKTRIAKEKAFK